MPRVIFTHAIQRHVACPPRSVPGRTVHEALEAVFAGNTKARSYVLDDQGVIRKHMAIFVDGKVIQDRDGLSDAVHPESEIYVMQALSGG